MASNMGTQKVALTGSYMTDDGQRVKVDLGGASISATLGDQQAKTTAVTLQSAATAIGVGTPFTVGAYKTLTISITGTSTSRTVIFESSDVDGNWTPIMGVRKSDFATGTQTNGTSEKWTFDITGDYQFRTNLTAVAGGNVTVKGTAVA